MGSEVMNRMMRKDVHWVTDSHSMKSYDSYALENDLNSWTALHKDCFVQALATTLLPNSTEIMMSIVYLRPEDEQEKLDRECSEGVLF